MSISSGGFLGFLPSVLAPFLFTKVECVDVVRKDCPEKEGRAPERTGAEWIPGGFGRMLIMYVWAMLSRYVGM